MSKNQVCASLDFGNKNVVIGVPKKGSIDIILNEASNRLTPTIVSYTKTRRFFGVHAQTNQLGHVKGTLFDLKRLVCLKYEDPEREYLSKIVPFSLARLDNGFTGIKVKYNEDTEKVIYPEQCIAYLIKSTFDKIQKSNPQITSLVIAVSPWWTEMHRRAIFDACQIASVPCSALINSTTAAAINYTINHRRKLPEGGSPPANVIFIDFGDSTLNVAVSKLTQNSVEISSFACDEHLGGSHFTDKLVLYLVDRIKEKTNKNKDEDLKTLFGNNHERALVRFRKAAEDLKKKLSVNQVVQFETHSFMPDNEFSFNVTREEFESQITELIDRIDGPVLSALELSKIKREEIFSIECLGGTSRIPLVKKKLQIIFGPDRELSQSLDLDECFAVGSGYMAAIMSNGFHLSESLTIKDVLDEKNALKASWEDSNSKMICQVFPQLSPVPTRCRIPLMITKETTVKIYTDACDIAEIKVELDEKEELEKPVKVSLRFQLTQSSTFNIIEATYQLPTESSSSSTEQTQTTPNNDNEKSNNDASPKDDNKDATSDVKNDTKNEDQSKPVIKNARLTIKSLIGLSQQDIDLFRKEEKELEIRDNLEDKIDDTRNELESTIFEAENGLNRDFPEYFEPENLEESKKKIADIHEWFSNNEFDRLPLKEYQERLEAVRNIAEPAIKRFKTFKKIFDMENSIKSKAPLLLEKLNAFVEKSKNDSIALVRDELQVFVTKFEENIEKVKTMKKYENPDFFNIDDECNLFNNFEQKTRDYEETIKQEEEKAKKSGRWCNIQ